MCEPRMISGRFGGHLVGAFAEHYLKISERKKLPTGRGKIAFKAELFDEILGRGGKVLNRQNVTRMHYFSIHFLSQSL